MDNLNTESIHNSTPSGEDLSRRDILKWGAAAGAAWLLSGKTPLKAAESGKSAIGSSSTESGQPVVWVFQSKDKVALMTAALKVIMSEGGFGKPGQNPKSLALKVNAAWAQGPEIGANTNPELVKTLLAGARERGISEIIIPENSCDNPRDSFPRSGILEVARSNNARMLNLKESKNNWIERVTPNCEALKKAMVARQFFDADTFINFPVAKHHGGTRLSIALKNWMGAVENRQFWHGNNLANCVADAALVFRPSWTLIDATITMMDSGPRGKGRLRQPNILILSRDQVAADAYAASLFRGDVKAGFMFANPAWEEVNYLNIVKRRELGVVDPAAMQIHFAQV